MFNIEQIIKFELRAPGPLVVHAILKLVIFMTKLSKANLPVNCYLLLKILQKAMYLVFLQLDQVNYKIYHKKNARF